MPDPSDIADRELSRLLTVFKQFESGSVHRIFLTDNLHPSDSRSNKPWFDRAWAKEMSRLLNKGAFSVVSTEGLGPDSNELGGRFVLLVENVETDDPLYKLVKL